MADVDLWPRLPTITDLRYANQRPRDPERSADQYVNQAPGDPNYASQVRQPPPPRSVTGGPNSPISRTVGRPVRISGTLTSDTDLCTRSLPQYVNLAAPAQAYCAHGYFFLAMCFFVHSAIVMQKSFGYSWA
jgi:hypothetical protein